MVNRFYGIDALNIYLSPDGGSYLFDSVFTTPVSLLYLPEGYNLLAVPDLQERLTNISSLLFPAAQFNGANFTVTRIANAPRLFTVSEANGWEYWLFPAYSDSKLYQVVSFTHPTNTSYEFQLLFNYTTPLSVKAIQARPLSFVLIFCQVFVLGFFNSYISTLLNVPQACFNSTILSINTTYVDLLATYYDSSGLFPLRPSLTR